MTEETSVASPPGLPQSTSNATSTPTPNEGGGASGEIKCVCEFTDDDGYTICCDKCETWQHVECMQMSNDVPEEYLCPDCSPRPIDVRKAKESQQKRRRRDGETDRGARQTKRKRSSTTSQKKKELQPNSATSEKPTRAEKAPTTKPPSPKDPQPPNTSRKGSRRNNNSHTNASSTTGSPGYIPDRNGDGESDNDNEKYKYEYTEITADKFMDDKVRDFLLEAVSASNPRSKEQEDHLKRFTRTTFLAVPFPKLLVKHVPDFLKSYSEHPRWCLATDSAISKGKLVAVFKGEIGFQDAYKSETINQYSLWNHPKPYVIFHPDLPVYIDARHFGSDARFVRRSCKPNLDMRTLVIDESEFSFGLYASESLKPGTELTIAWDWNGSTPSQKLCEEGFDLTKLSPEEVKATSAWVDNLLEKMGDCACGGGDDCLLTKVKRLNNSENLLKPPVLTNGRKPKTKRQPSTEPNRSKEPTPDRNSVMSEEDGSKASLVPTKVKSRSRDRTPFSNDTSADASSMTSREARKFKDVLSRIEKQEQEDHLNPPTNKRRKRNSTSVQNPSSPPGDDSKGVINPKKTKHPAHKSSTGVAEVSVADARTGRRRTSDSSDHSDRQKRQRFSGSPAESLVWSNPRRKAVLEASKSNYVDVAVQTDPEEELPWWQQPVQRPSPPEPRLPLRKLLLQSMLKDRVQSESPDKKRKFDSIGDPSSDESNKAVKLDDGMPSNESMAADSLSSGPALRELFADTSSDGSMKPPPQPNKVGEKPPNGVKPSGLHLQLPPSGFPMTPTTPSQAVMTPGSVSAGSPLSGAAMFSPSVASAVAGGVSPSPTKTKKLTLAAYGKRKLHKGCDPSDKKDEEKTAREPPTPSGSLTALEQRKLADIISTAVEPITPPSVTPDKSLGHGLGTERTANSLGGVR